MALYLRGCHHHTRRRENLISHKLIKCFMFYSTYVITLSCNVHTHYSTIKSRNIFIFQNALGRISKVMFRYFFKFYQYPPLPGGKRGRGVTLTTHHLECWRQEWGGQFFPFPLRACMALAGQLFTTLRIIESVDIRFQHVRGGQRGRHLKMTLVWDVAPCSP
jgi:hypothetical protein